MNWINFIEEKPPLKVPILVTDGEYCLPAKYLGCYKSYSLETRHEFEEYGIWGYDYELDINKSKISHWALIELNNYLK